MRKNESFEQLVARVKAESFIEELPEERRYEKPKRKHRLVAKAEKLTKEQLSVLLALLLGEAALLVVRGKPYAVKPSGETWYVRSLDVDAEEHSIVNGECSCADHRFRKHRCKHMEAVEMFR